MPLYTVIFTIFLCIGGIAAQTPQFIELEPKSHRLVPGVQASLIEGVVRCDESSNIYFTPAGLKGRTLNRGKEVIRVSRDGKKVTSFSLSEFEGFGDASVEDYSPGVNGELTLLTGVNQQSFLLFFDSDGAARSKARIETEGIRWSKVGVFGPDALFAWGERMTDGVPLNAILNYRGQVLRYIELPKDLKPKLGISGSNLSGFDQNTMALHLSVVTSGEDRVYVGRATPEGPIYAIKSTGEVQSIQLQPPSNSASFYDLKVSHGLLAVVYVEKLQSGSSETQRGYITVYDGVTGKPWRRYLSNNSQLGFALACYTPDDLEFVGTTEKGELDILHAGPK